MQTTDQPNLPSARAGKSQHQSIHALDPRLGSRSRIGDSQSRPEDPDFPTAPQSLLSQGTASDEPSWSIGSNGKPILIAHLPIADIGGFLRQRQEIAFVVIKASIARTPLPATQAFKEVITFNSQNMIDAVESFFALQPMFKEEFPDFNVRAHIAAPYLFWYHYRSPVALDNLGSLHRPLMQSLTDWIEEHYQALYTRVESQMEKGVISQETMPFLVKPGDILVWENKNKFEAVIARSWSRCESLYKSSKPQGTSWEINPAIDAEKASSVWVVDGWQYSYDGRFLESDEVIKMRFKKVTMAHEVEINKLSAYPLRYASEHLKAVLERRGQTFWKCRRRHIVSYSDVSGFYGSGDRFVVDFHTYKQLHHDSHKFKLLYPHMDPERLDLNDPPESPDIYVFPRTIPGYDLHSKKWVDLDVDSIYDVTWNKQSFDYLVVDAETKELVQALVMRQIAREQSTDIIDRKGNGLIMLLHGGPGTGKTFTAESVAEFAEKPLFRVTCGDIGTEPEQVERYLESVLHLGKTWGCVMLIDEAEVFLEQRSLDNLARNALVSVFLRVLEYVRGGKYYEGILILTSNRVGTFDEAFKSRILLSLHYENLTEGQRMKIWKNFINRMKAMEKGKGLASRESVFQTGPLAEFQGDNVEVDFDDVECYLAELSKKQRMSYDHLKHVIKVSSKFDKYLKAVQDDQTSDEIARSDGFR
ncbi:P-loop containing nucleoside triphosphate hydrolase protein [Nemania diffusa]|nr:P-loop containing nucleoside triphosphate hydrolase protein [Nemania diffusa]